MDPVGEAGAFLQSYGWYCVGAALVVVFVVRPKLEELSHARSLAAAQNPARREALDRKRREVVDRQQHTLAEDVKNNPPPPKPKPRPKPAPAASEGGSGGLRGFAGGGGYQPTRRTRPGGGGG